jgi:hypothetical protein
MINATQYKSWLRQATLLDNDHKVLLALLEEAKKGNNQQIVDSLARVHSSSVAHRQNLVQQINEFEECHPLFQLVPPDKRERTDPNTNERIKSDDVLIDFNDNWRVNIVKAVDFALRLLEAKQPKDK